MRPTGTTVLEGRVSKRKAGNTSKKQRPAAARRASTSRPRTVARKASARKTAARAAAARSPRRKASPKPSRLATAATLVRGTAAAAVAAVAQRLPWTEDENDPIVLLESDHRRFEQLLKQGEETTARAVKGRTELLQTLAAALNVHEALEERLLYPALEPHDEIRDTILEGYQEHHVADLIMRELHTLAKGNEKWGAKFKVLKENIEHHIEEEEGQMFRMARTLLDRDQLTDLGRKMKKLRRELEA
jgi:hypothetical protein